jgi:twitching motility protein PilT
VVRDQARSPQGLVLFTGPTGSGKSTTMASLIDWINATRACHVITIEDPIEYVHRNDLAIVHQREIGTDARSFERALRSALREDPDVILVGEMRDPESIAIALTLAETGHLVLSTLHTNDAPQALDRIVDVFPGDRQTQIRLQLASVLNAVVAQRLLPRTDGGLVAAFEVLVGTEAVRNLVREGKTRQLRNVITTSRAEGMQTLEHSMNGLLSRGLISYEAAVARAPYPSELVRPLLPPRL